MVLGGPSKQRCIAVRSTLEANRVQTRGNSHDSKLLHFSRTLRIYTFYISSNTSIPLCLTPIMDQEETWTSLFFSGNCPRILEKNELPVKSFRPFSPEVDNWKIGPQIDGYRRTSAATIQVFWIRIRGHRKYVAKVVSRETSFICYSISVS